MAEKFGIGSLGLDKVGIGPLNVGNVLDTVEFVRNAWSSFGIPSSFAPTVDIGELDKRIADLKTVEQWLAVNMSLLQGTIRALEIQRGTIATLQAVGAPVAAAAPAAAALAAALGQMPGATAQAAEGAAPAGAGTAEAPVGSAPRASKPKPTRRGRPGAGATAPSGFVDPGLSPGAWWNLLQEQFNQVASAALSGVGMPKPGTAGGSPGPVPGRAPPARGQAAARRGKAGARPGGAGKSKRAKGRDAGGGSRKD